MALPGTPVPSLITESKARARACALEKERAVLDSLVNDPVGLGFYASLAVHNRLGELEQIVPRPKPPVPSRSPELERLDRPRPSSVPSSLNVEDDCDLLFPDAFDYELPEKHGDGDSGDELLGNPFSPMDDPFGPIDFAAYEGKANWREDRAEEPTRRLGSATGWEFLESLESEAEVAADSKDLMDSDDGSAWSDMMASPIASEAAPESVQGPGPTPTLSDVEMMDDDSGDCIDSAEFARLVASHSSPAEDGAANAMDATTQPAEDSNAPAPASIQQPQPLASGRPPTRAVRACAKMLVRAGLRCQECYSLMRGGRCTSCSWVRPETLGGRTAPSLPLTLDG